MNAAPCYNQCSFARWDFLFSNALPSGVLPLNRVSDALESVVAKSLQSAPLAERVLLAWPVACGSAVANRTKPIGFSDGVLRIEVSDKAWQRELSALAPRYLAALNRYISPRVRRIEFVVRP